MSHIQLPPLPELPPFQRGVVIRLDEAHKLMREYATAAVKAERERCAKLAEQASREAPEVPHKEYEGYVEGYIDAANDLELAIRDGIEP